MSRALSDGSAKEIEINNGKMLPKLIVPFLLEFSLLQIIKDRLNIGAKPLGRATGRKKDIMSFFINLGMALKRHKSFKLRQK